MPLTIRSDHARGEVEQRQRRIAFLLAAELITHAELGAELGRDFGGLLDVLLATGQYPFAGLEILVAAFEHAIFDGAVDTHLGAEQEDGTTDARTDEGHDSLLDGTGASL